MATYDEIMADIDARNPTKPGQFTGKPVTLNQKEFLKIIEHSQQEISNESLDSLVDRITRVI